ncbi:MAG: lysophospholipid acyltransferase family protein [Planctomycetaceae bacterium]
MPFLRALFRVSVRGPRPAPSPRGVLLAPNHQSWLDPIFVQAAVYPHRITFLMTELFFDLPLVGRYFRAVGALPIREGRPSVEGFRAARDALEAGSFVCLFPEGGLTSDGLIQKGHRGVARLARLTGATVIPIGVRGTIRVLSRLQRTPRLHPVEIRLGEPMPPAAGEGREAEVRYTGELMRRIEALAAAP